MNFITAVAG